MTHDPLCPSTNAAESHYCALCHCELIAKVRGDEKGLSDEDIFNDGQQAMLAKCIAAVEYLHDHEAPHDAHKDALWNAITALRALQEKP